MHNTTPVRTSWLRDYFNVRTWPFWACHLGAIYGIYLFGFSWAGLGLALALYYARMFFVTGAYHRYFSHRAFKTSRWFQFVLALFGGMCAQKGALWWAEHHRVHHKYSDTPYDPHSMKLYGFWWSHLGWILSHQYKLDHNDNHVGDLMKYPELRWLDRHYLVPVALYGALLYGGGELWSAGGGLWAVTWGLAVSTVMLWQGTFCINSVSHWRGSRRFPTSDASKNNGVLALLTLGEGWHNNHHYYQSCARQGFYWWEVDVTYYVLRLMAAVGLIWDVREPPQRLLDEGGHATARAVHALDVKPR
jgi:stearoyl-CoA desaturase (delta-9 desaturase)